VENTGVDMPAVPADGGVKREVTPSIESKAIAAADGNRSSEVEVQTDVFDLEINPVGGVIEKARLLRFPKAVDTPNDPVVLLDNSPSLLYVTQGGFRGAHSAPDHNSEYHVEKSAYRLADNEDTLQVRLTWISEQNVEFAKIYSFRRGSHVVDLRYEIRNNGTAAWAGRLYGQLQRRFGGESSGMVYTYTGAAISSSEKRYEKISFDDMTKQPLSRDVTDGWIAMLQHYFVVAMSPEPSIPHTFFSMALPNQRFVIGMYGPELQVAEGASANAGFKLYLGPKEQKVLETVAPNLELTADYGVLWFIAKPIFWLLDKFHSFTGNWGWSIILVTLLLKAAFFNLSATSYKSMAKMRRLQPRMVALRERYADDKHRLNTAMMELYKEEKINPLGGCLPVLVQIPVFIALYWVLLETVELRQASFMFWLKDLSTPDPYFILPLLMGVSMYFQQKLSPTSLDPLQQKVFQILPDMFTAMFAFFASGLVLYWVVNNIISIAQQWIITKKYGDPVQPSKAPS
jgi:YidC/Oxa1 family membrane protein insertase